VVPMAKLSEEEIPDYCNWCRRSGLYVFQRTGFPPAVCLCLDCDRNAWSNSDHCAWCWQHGFLFGAREADGFHRTWYWEYRSLIRAHPVEGFQRCGLHGLCNVCWCRYLDRLEPPWSPNHRERTEAKALRLLHQKSDKRQQLPPSVCKHIASYISLWWHP